MLCCDECDYYIKNGNPGFMDYAGMVTDLRLMKRNFYKRKNTKTFRFDLNWEETQFLNDLCEFEDICVDMKILLNLDIVI